jgi:putative aldouronate transport system substrate-binding protein
LETTRQSACISAGKVLLLCHVHYTRFDKTVEQVFEQIDGQIKQTSNRERCGGHERRMKHFQISARTLQVLPKLTYLQENKEIKKMKQFARQIMFVVVLFSMVLSACAPAATPAPVAVPTAAPADPYGKYATPVTMTTVRQFETTEKLPTGDTPENNQYTRYLKTTLNIDTQYLWTAASADYEGKVDLAISSNDLPDAMQVNLRQLTQLVNNDQIADLTDTYNNYASPSVKRMMDSSKGIALKAVTFNGKIMAIPALTVPDDGYQLMWIRKDWLDKVGLPIPKTVDDIEKTAQAFITQDPGGNGAGKTIGIVGPQNGGALNADFLNPTNGNFGFDPVFFSYHAYPGFWVKGADGKAAYGSIQPETKTALARLADLYKKGLIDPEMGTRKDSSAPIAAGTAGIYFGEWWNGYWPLPDAVKNNPKANWQAYAVPLDSAGVCGTRTRASPPHRLSLCARDTQIPKRP